MEITKIEVQVLENTSQRANEIEIAELHELELALVGGGNGTVIFG